MYLGLPNPANGTAQVFADPVVPDPKTRGGGAAIGVRKDDNELRQQINKALADIIQDGTYQRIAHKYFSFDVYN